MAVEELVTQPKTLWKFDYETKIKALRELYEVAKKQQWNAATDIPWDLEIEAGGDILDPTQDAFRELDVVKALPEDKQVRLATCNVAGRLQPGLGAELTATYDPRHTPPAGGLRALWTLCPGHGRHQSKMTMAWD